MNNVSGHLAILAGAGVAAALLALATYVGRRMETSTTSQAPVVVTVPARTAHSPAPPPPTAPRQAPPATASPRDPASLARQLQSELRRVGCYDGELSGVWSLRTRAAMKAFTDRVNASLPVDKPDQILLALVQNHQGVACVLPPVLAKAPAKPEPLETDAAPRPVPIPAIMPPIAAVVPRVQRSRQPVRHPRLPSRRRPKRRSHSGAAAGAAATCFHGRARRASTAQPAPRRPGAGSRRLRASSAPHRPLLSPGSICACAAAKPEARRVDAVALAMIGAGADSA